MHSPEERESELLLLKNDLESYLGDNIVSVTAYGSSMSDDYCSLSDIDVLVILKTADNESLQRLREIRQRHETKGFEIDINVHASDETPDARGKTFWHNNRALYMQIELALYGRQLIGEKPFDGKEVRLDDLRLEIVRVTSSLAYQARKILINSELNVNKRITMMKWCIYGVMYSLAFWEIYPKTKREAMSIFQDRFNPRINPGVFLKQKTENLENILQSDMELAYDFLSELQSIMLGEYRKIYGSEK